MHRGIKRRVLSLTVILLLVGSVLVIVPGPALAQDNILSVTRTQETITIDGVVDEASWNDAIATTISCDKDGDSRDVELRALYDEQFVYFLATWEDESHSVQPDSWEWTGTEWDPSPHKEDRLSFLWNTDSEIDGFKQNSQGCAAMSCHDGQWTTNNDQEKGDLWQWLAARTNPTSSPRPGWMDDLSVDDTGIKPDDFAGSKVWEKNSKFANDDNESTEPYTPGDEPIWKVHDTNPPQNMDPQGLYLFDGFKMDIQPSDEFADEEQIPGYLLSIPSGDRADIAAKGIYDEAADTWTLEIKRKLMTGNAGDVAFNNLLNEHHFSLAVFDNRAGSDHYSSDLVTLNFRVPELELLKAEPSLTTPIVGDDINVTVSLLNKAGYSTGFMVALFLDDVETEPVLTKPFVDMASGADAEFNFTWDTSGVTPGKHDVIVKVDSTGVILEHDENNNVISTEIMVYPPIASFESSKSSPEEGKKIKLTINVSNPSDEDINVTVVIEEKGEVLLSNPVNVSAGSSVDVVFEWKAKKTGKHTFTAYLDGAPNTETTLEVNVKEESPGPGLWFAIMAIAIMAMAVALTRRRDAFGR
jgi:hypothetical protein